MKAAIKAYLDAHLRELPVTLKDLWSTKIASFMTILVIGIALALPSIFLMLFTNIKALAGTLESAPQISVFLKSSVSEDKRTLLEKTFKANPAISKVQYISKEEALKELSEGLSAQNTQNTQNTRDTQNTENTENTLNAQNTLSLLPENPLPSVFVLHLPLSIGEKSLQSLMQSIRVLPEVENVFIDLEWVKRLGTGLKVLNRLVTGITLLLSLAVLMVIGNTLRLHIENKKNSIEVAKLVGATDAFVRRPFLYLGFWYGIFGAIMALCLTLLLFSWVKNAASELLGLYKSSLKLEGLDMMNAGLLLLLGALLGIGGAFLSVGRHLRSLRPT